MSELRTYDVIMTPSSDGSWVLKSEADKVIAEKDKEIAELQAMLEERNKQVWEKDRIAPKQADKTLQERLNEVCEKHGVSTLQDLDWAFCESEKRHTKDNIEAAKEIEHHKYKRCLAMANRCGDAYDKWMMIQANARTLVKDGAGYYRQARWKVSHYMRWQKRWMKLAEKFKKVK